MLKAEINGRKGIVMVEANGALPELCADVTTLLGVMYNGLSEGCKEMFVKCIKNMAEEELFVKSSEELKEKLEEQVKEEEKKELEDLINLMPEGLIKALKDILK